MIGIAPTTSRTGGVIWTFVDSKITLVMKPSNSDARMLARDTHYEVLAGSIYASLVVLR
jgi:hypothetical protein